MKLPIHNGYVARDSKDQNLLEEIRESKYEKE